MAQLERPERIAQIKRDAERRMAEEQRRRPNKTLLEIYGAMLDDEDDASGCNICHL